MVYTTVTFTLLVFLIISVFFSFKYIFDYNTVDKSKIAGKKPKYHFVVIKPNIDDYFWNGIKKGIELAARDLNVAVELETSSFNNTDEQIMYLNIAIASKVDGIIINAVNDKLITPYINKAERLNIPVVTIENDAKDSKRKAFISTINFEAGVKAGNMLIEATDGKANVAIIMNKYPGNEENVSENLKIQGFEDTVKKQKGISIVAKLVSDNGVFGAEDVTQKVLSKYGDVNTIFCLSSRDTIGAAQVIVDQNKVGKVTIIGYGDSGDILRYIENGVIYGTIVSDSVKIGYDSIKNLTEIKENKNVSIFIDTGLYKVTSKNIKEYKNNIEKTKEQIFLK